MTVKQTAALFVFGFLPALLADAQSDRLAPGPPHETLLVVGEAPPTSFALPSVTDATIFDLEAQRGERPILLLFFRGAW